MRRTTLLVLAFTTSLLAPIGARAEGWTVANGGVTVTHDGAAVWMTSAGGFQRIWNAQPMYTYQVFGFGPWPDFSLQLGPVVLTSMMFTVDDVWAEPIAGGVRTTWELSLPGVLRVTRVVDGWGDVRGLRTRTILDPLVPLSLGAYTLDEVNASMRGGRATVHAFRAGADWRYDAGFDPVNVGDDHLGTWRETTSAGEFERVAAVGEWISVSMPPNDAFTVAMIMERRHAASSVAEFSPGVIRIGVDHSRDIVYTGPFEEQIHVENPLPPAPTLDLQTLARTPQPGARARTLVPGRPLELEPVLTVIAATPELEAWEFHKYLTRHRLPPYPKAVTFNTNGVDTNAISTGAKDDVDFARLRTLADAARELGVETFILDDGWQARSGDWCPDSPRCPEPRWDGEDMRFAPRFPDDEFRAVRDELAGAPGPDDDMDLGLWWTPMAFHPTSDAFMANPQWSCAPVGTATALPSYADGGGSFDAGIGLWNPNALGLHPDTGEPLRQSRHLEDRLRRAIDVYGARYFKFDFLVWVDCLGVEPVDMYDYHDAFVAMLDRLQATYPDVTFSIDETNDFRMFPFESVARGPSWFQNGKPRTEQLLHNQWNLAPFVPGYSLGQHAASNDTERAAKGVDAVMAVTLGQHITFWNAIDTAMTPAERAQIRRWTDFYKQHRDTLATFTLPLLDDPLADGWTALQPWDPDAQSGWLLAYRQSASGGMMSIPLRAILGDGTYTLTRHDPATPGPPASLGSFTADHLRTGLEVAIDDPDGYALIRIERA